ncbi:MAG: OmpA family protein [Paludibacteraceae bacterium]|nr:OmpA family protein [Paludibacteraceae bacterium]
MKNLLRNILIASVVLSLNAAPIAAYAMPEPAPATQTAKQKAAAQKKKEAEKRKKEQEKAKAAREKQKAAAAKKREAEKKREAAAKANEKKQAERDKAAAERAKAAEERAEAQAKKEAETKAKEEKALRDYEKYQENLANPKTEVISYFNLGLRLGYAAMMDQINGSYLGAGTLNQSNALQQLKGGLGAGLDITYNLEYGHFLFETGLDFRFLNSTSAYGFQAQRTENTYGATYNYLFDNVREMRNMLEFGLPVMFGAQFNRFYFLVGAKVHYGLPMGYSQKGKYDIVVNDPALLEPYGMGIHELNGETKQKMAFKQPDVSVAAEIGIDLDDWLQAQPDPKAKKAKVKPGQRLPFGREHIHYRVGLFAEYGVLNTNNTPAALPVEFAQNSELVQNSNTFLAWGGDTKLNNLLVGAKFTIQFEVPGKKARPVPPPASYAIYSVVNAVTNEPIDKAFVETRGAESGKIAMREKQINAKGFRQRHAVGAFIAKAKANGYYEAEQNFEIEKVGGTEYVTIALRPCPILRVRVTNKETGLPVPATVQIHKSGVEEPAYSLATDSASGTTRQMLEEGPRYSLHIAQMGYDTIDMAIANIGDSLNIQLTPIKKGEVFIVKNLHFATNKTRILSRSEQALNDLYMYLARNPQVRIKIIGHTDNVGKDAANQKLSDGRANAVMQDLIERGIAPERLQAEGRGETQPIDTNDTEEGRQNNRRVEIEIL